MHSPSSDTEKDGTSQNGSVLDRITDTLTYTAAALGAIVVLVMVAIVGYSVVNRYIFGTPITWTDELSGYLVVALVMLGAAEALRRGDHIAVDLVSSRLGRTGKHLTEIWSNIAILIVSIALLISTKSSLDYSYNFDILSEGYLEVPMWIPQSFLAIGNSLLALVALLNLIRLLGWRRLP